jgi:biopolymer transport protein ExbD
MAMAVGPAGGDGDPDVLMEMNTTPLIDVMLVLLVMLIITIPIQTHAVKLDMPAGHQSPPVPPQVVTIDVDFDGTLSWNGETLGGEQQLRQRMQVAAAQPDQPEVHLRPNKLVTYKYVAHVMADAQRLGLKKLGLVGNEQFVGEN